MVRRRDDFGLTRRRIELKIAGRSGGAHLEVGSLTQALFSSLLDTELSAMDLSFEH